MRQISKRRPRGYRVIRALVEYSFELTPNIMNCIALRMLYSVGPYSISISDYAAVYATGARFTKLFMT